MKKTQDPWVHVGGSGVWTEFQNKKTGESTVKSLGKLSQMPKTTIYDECDHQGHWQLSGENAVQCSLCGLGRKIVWGIDIVKDGVLSKLTPKL